MLRKDDVPSASENEVIDATVRFFLRRQSKSFKPGQTSRRALHGKSLGTVSAKFIINALPAELQQGIFAQAGKYDAVVRFSNGSLGPNAPDILPNVRGVAFKIYNLDQPNVLAEEGSESGRAAECDFLMVNAPTFFVRDIGFIEAIMRKNLVKILSYVPALVLNLVLATNQLVTNVLHANYFTQVPHWFGDRPCKYALIAQTAVAGITDFWDPDYLRHGLERELQTSSARYNFCVQFKQPDESMEILTQKWNGPMLTLATLELERRQSSILESDGEELSFNPFRTPSAHQPAGWVGRLRKAVYKADFDWRQKQIKQS